MWCLTGDEDCVQGKVAKVEEVKTIAEPGVCVVPCWTNTDCDGCGGGRCFRGRVSSCPNDDAKREAQILTRRSA